MTPTINQHVLAVNIFGRVEMLQYRKLLCDNIPDGSSTEHGSMFNSEIFK